MSFSGCYEYEDVDLQANKKVFVEPGTVQFRNLQTSEIVELHAYPFTCNKGTYSEVHYSYHFYKRYYPETCGQAIFRNNETLHILDHSVKAESSFSTNDAHMYFQNDQFQIDPLPADSAALDSLTIGGEVFVNTFVLQPEATQGTPMIEEIYYDRDYGLLQIKDINAQIWIRIQ